MKNIQIDECDVVKKIKVVIVHGNKEVIDIIEELLEKERKEKK